MNFMLKQNQGNNTRKIGSKYEQMAKEYLETKGYLVVCTNYRCQIGEIDIIAKNEDYIIFVEVKYRSKSTFGYPREAVNYKKQQKIKAVAKYFLKSQLHSYANCRFDIIEILGISLIHIKAAF